MKLIKSRPKTELQLIKDVCKTQGFDYDEAQLNVECDTIGNIINIETMDVKLQNILKAKGFVET